MLRLRVRTETVKAVLNFRTPTRSLCIVWGGFQETHDYSFTLQEEVITQNVHKVSWTRLLDADLHDARVHTETNAVNTPTIAQYSAAVVQAETWCW